MKKLIALLLIVSIAGAMSAQTNTAKQVSPAPVQKKEAKKKHHKHNHKHHKDNKQTNK